METALLIAVIGTLCIACFFVGAKIGQQVSRGETISAPEINPMEAVRRQQERKAARDEQNRVDAILHNIEAYDGTASGQKDIPGR